MPAAYCFVEFKDAATAQKALFSLNGKIIPNSGGTVSSMRLTAVFLNQISSLHVKLALSQHY